MTTAGTSTASALCTGPNHCHAGRASVSRSPLSVGFHPFERPSTRPPLQMQGAIRPGGSGVVRRTRGKTGCEPRRSAAGLTNPVTMNAKASIARRCSWLERGHGVCFSPRQTPHRWKRASGRKGTEREPKGVCAVTTVHEKRANPTTRQDTRRHGRWRR